MFNKDAIKLDTNPENIETEYLRHTKLISAVFGNVHIPEKKERVSWSLLLQVAIREAPKKHRGAFDALICEIRKHVNGQ